MTPDLHQLNRFLSNQQILQDNHWSCYLFNESANVPVVNRLLTESHNRNDWFQKMRLYLLSCPRKNIVLFSSSKNYSFSSETGAAPALLFRVRYVSLSLTTAISHTVVEMNLDLISVSVSVSFTGVLVPSVGGLECPPKCRDPPMNNFR